MGIMVGNMNAADIIDALGGPAEVSKLLKAPVNTVRNWRERKSIPAKYHGAILSVAAGRVTAEEIIAAHTGSAEVAA